MPATPCSAMPSLACSSTRAGAWSASTTTTMPAARWTASARPWRRATSPAAGSRRRSPRTATTASYIDALALELQEEVGTAYVDMPPEERLPLVRQAAAERVLRWIDRTLERFGVVFDTYMSEASLAEKHEIEQAIERLRAAGHIYEEDGAVWFRSTTFGDDKDRVVIRSNGIHTYFAADMRLRDRQVLTRVRPSDLRLGRRPPRRRRSREGCRPGARATTPTPPRSCSINGWRSSATARRSP